ncbi:unnamed protein product [Cuscuta campestris]|uniref:Uncharacterized protein n=1 Tax=Cuscuta campestris TaxID=132261 RepID=A0A484M925_9ASTE|nr:unnamed protein product [Cuscuta campestris]
MGECLGWARGGKVYDGEEWPRICMLHATISIQMFVGTAVFAATFFTPAANKFFTAGAPYGPILVIAVSVLLVVIFGWAMDFYTDDFPYNCIFFGLFSLVFPFMIGVVSACAKGMTLAIAVGVTALVFVALTLYSSFLAKRAMSHPHMEGTIEMICGYVGALIFSGVIITNTHRSAASNFRYVEAACQMYFHYPLSDASVLWGRVEDSRRVIRARKQGVWNGAPRSGGPPVVAL